MARDPIPFYNFPMDSSLHRWRAAWQKASAFLQRERAQRLRDMSDDDVRAAIAAIFTSAAPREAPERGSGLVEQQRLFRKLR